jgi:Rieske 2Fe-2S family protein
LAALWRKTNEQDGHFSAINHRGIASDGYIQGPYAVEEKLVDDFKSFYVSRATAALEKIS